MRTLLSLCLLLTASAHAQIFADFTVSSGGITLGTFTVTLEHQKAPRTCANFIGLASGKRPWIDVTNGAVRTNTPYYNGLTFHRLIHSFVIQGGSPNGQGTDGPGYSILDEYEPTLRHSAQYVLSMAKQGTSRDEQSRLVGGPNTGGSQFFITLRATPELNDKHSIFGTVTSGTAIIDGFKNATNFPTGARDKPLTPIVIDSVVFRGSDYESFDIAAPSLRLPHVSGTPMTVTRDASASLITATFPRLQKTAYYFLGSPDLSTWSNPKYVFSLDSSNSYSYQSEGRNETAYFLNLATVSYVQVPNAPSALLTQGNPVRVLFPGGTYLEFLFNGTNGGTWYDSSQDRTGNLATTSWNDRAPDSGTLEDTSPQAYNLALGSLATTLLDYPSPGASFPLKTWLSFHSESSGWLEEQLDGNTNRLAFEILSN